MMKRSRGVLAQVTAGDGTVLAGTREAIVIGDRRVPWEEVHSADWDLETETFTVAEVGEWGEQRPVHRFTVSAPGKFLPLVRERVTASLVLQQHFVVRGGKGFFVIARRPPTGRGAMRWSVDFEVGIDPTEAAVAERARAALEECRAELGGLTD